MTLPKYQGEAKMRLQKILVKIFIGLLFSIMFGCRSVPSTVPPTQNIPNYNSTSTQTPGNTGMDMDVAIKEATSQMEMKLPAKTKMALVSVSSSSSAFSEQVLNRLESTIVSSGKLVVVDRANLDKIRTEQGFQLSGEVDDNSAKAIGKLLGAGALPVLLRIWETYTVLP
jgi:curli biogenesis system outer membrane secretion channel CsgG